MAYCIKCGGRVEDTDKKCPFCGADIPVIESKQQSQTQSQAQTSEYTYGQNYNGQSTYNPYYAEPVREGYFNEAEVKKNKVMGVLCYLGILVFIPILAGDKDSEYLKLHKNQGLILFIIDTIVDLLEKSWIRIGFLGNLTGAVISVGCDIISFVLAILWILGIVYACRGTKNELPGIGKIKIFK